MRGDRSRRSGAGVARRALRRTWKIGYRKSEGLGSDPAIVAFRQYRVMRRMVGSNLQTMVLGRIDILERRLNLNRPGVLHTVTEHSLIADLEHSNAGVEL